MIRDPDAARHRMGVALQEAGLDPRQTGRELLVLQGRLFELSPREAAARAEALLELVELEEAADRRINSYSGGMKRRLDLASALSTSRRCCSWTSRPRGSTRRAG